MTRRANIIETIGNTPVVKINKLAPAGIDRLEEVIGACIFHPIILSFPL